MRLVDHQANLVIRDALATALLNDTAADEAACRIAGYAKPAAIELALARVRRALDYRRGVVGTKTEQILSAAASLVSASEEPTTRRAANHPRTRRRSAAHPSPPPSSEVTTGSMLRLAARTGPSTSTG
jgi:hypothetical protein